ncbi:hypothetical protein LEP1GSC123_3213 [Leptospira borgpetersenii str. 200701203]|uniref:Uncharacterized protein n=1 Tax=Leptospira borgpetersenii str. 200701203 TaxID=1193007 RepID=M3HKY9_LEPBO|nr:hypothetical protein LEP1GSC123_3213 [Leptospira borgpetersenii str. 200701203]
MSFPKKDSLPIGDNHSQNKGRKSRLYHSLGRSRNFRNDGYSD